MQALGRSVSRLDGKLRIRPFPAGPQPRLGSRAFPAGPPPQRISEDTPEKIQKTSQKQMPGTMSNRISRLFPRYCEEEDGGRRREDNSKEFKKRFKSYEIQSASKFHQNCPLLLAPATKFCKRNLKFARQNVREWFGWFSCVFHKTNYFSVFLVSHQSLDMLSCTMLQHAKRSYTIPYHYTSFHASRSHLHPSDLSSPFPPQCSKREWLQQLSCRFIINFAMIKHPKI